MQHQQQRGRVYALMPQDSSATNSVKEGLVVVYNSWVVYCLILVLSILLSCLHLHFHWVAFRLPVRGAIVFFAM